MHAICNMCVCVYVCLSSAWLDVSDDSELSLSWQLDGSVIDGGAYLVVCLSGRIFVRIFDLS